MHTGVVHDLDFDCDGKRSGWIGIPFSVDRSPYFQVRIPICVVRNGAGPSLLLMAGNHGDEYEGELTLARLMRRIEPAEMRGLLTILPLANMPAVMAGKRCSPLDAGNLNRAFPGDPSGGPTARLAHFLERDLFPRFETIFDLHAGGTSMAHLPCALIERDPDQAKQERGLALMHALGLGHGFVADNGPAAPTSMGAARRAGAIGLSGEFGGGGAVTPQTMAISAGAVDRLMQALEMMDTPLLGGTPPAPRMQQLSLSRHSQGLFATRRCWFEPAVRLGDRVEAGDLAGFLHDLEALERPEAPLRFAEAGVVISMRLHTMCESGDCLMQVAEPVN